MISSFSQYLIEGKKEQGGFKRHVQLPRVSETRESFVAGNLFKLGESVIISKTDEVGIITVLGSNYVIVEVSGRRTRQWLDSVEKVDEGYSPQKHEEGTPAAVAYAKKMTPGERSRVVELGLEVDPVSKAKDITSKDKVSINKDRQADKIKHGHILGRARRSRMLRKNRA